MHSRRHRIRLGAELDLGQKTPKTAFDRKIDALVSETVKSIAELVSEAFEIAKANEPRSLSLTNVLDALQRLQTAAKAGA